jgi:hypothetical protein
MTQLELYASRGTSPLPPIAREALKRGLMDPTKRAIAEEVLADVAANATGSVALPQPPESRLHAIVQMVLKAVDVAGR